MALKINTTIVTIVAYNYLPQALALHDSIKTYDVRFVVILVEPLNTCELPDGLEIYYAEEIIGDIFSSMSFMYSIIELCTNIKPAILNYFLNDSDYLYYIDPDIYFYQNPALVNDEFGLSDVLITPHSLTPIMDEFSPSDLEFMRTGVYNLGFIGLRKSSNSKKFLVWWGERCLNYGLNETSSGLFVDQKFIDLSLAFYSFISISRNYGLNVGYWNLHERFIRQEGGELFVNGDKLIFYHFSGLDPVNPGSISKHQNRYTLSDRADLRTLFNEYAAIMTGFMSGLKKTNLPFSKFDNGVLVTDFARRFYWRHRTNYVPGRIFLSSSELYRDLISKGLIRAGNKSFSTAYGSQTNLSKFSLQMAIFDIFLKISLRALGPERFWNLIKFVKQRFSPISKLYFW